MNASFASNVTLPLLDGLNAWWACSLNKTATGPGPNDYVYHDTAKDEEHEKGVSVDPQIALAFAWRTLSAQLQLSAALGLPQPPRLLDILSHLAPFNTDAGCDPANKWPCGGWNWTSPTGTSYTDLSVWTAYGGAPIHNSDSFSLYPLWPSEGLLSGPSPPPADAALRAQNSGRAYAKLVGGRPVDTFASAVLAGQGFVFKGRPGGSVMSGGQVAREVAFSPLEVLQGLLGQMAVPCPHCCGLQQIPCGPGGVLWGENLMLYTDGGGVENLGIVRALNEMLVTSVGGVGGVVSLFPFWPATEPCTFQGLLVKGGIEVSASYSNATGKIESPVGLRVSYTWEGAATGVVRLGDPWGGGAGSIGVACEDGSKPTVAWAGGVAVFNAPLAVQCSVTPVGARGSLA